MELKYIFENTTRTILKDGTMIAFVDKMEELSKIVNENEFVLDHFHDTTADAFGVENKKENRDGVRDHVLNVSAIAVCYNKSTILGFASIKQLANQNVFYLHGIAMRLALQGKGIGDAMIQGLLSKNQGWKFVTLTTQSPIVYCLIKRYCSDLFPSLNHQPIPRDLQEIGADLMKQRKGDFDPVKFVSHNLYSKCLYGHGIPMSRDKELNCWFEKSLRITEGMSNDGLLLLGKLK